MKTKINTNINNNSTIIITGAASGIGRAFAVEGYNLGFNLALLDINSDELNKLKEDLSKDVKKIKITTHTLDVSNENAWGVAVKDIKTEHENVSLLVNNAGISLSLSTFGKTSTELFDKVININQMGALYAIRNILPILSYEKGSGIINISSLAGLSGLYGYSAYSMSKMALRGLGEALQMEFAGTPLHCLNVFPGGVKTNIMKNAPDLNVQDAKRIHATFQKASGLKPEDVASKSLKAFYKGRNSLILGVDAKIILGIKKIFGSRSNQLLKTIFMKQQEMNKKMEEKI